MISSRTIVALLPSLLSIYCVSLTAHGTEPGFNYDNHIGFVSAAKGRAILAIKNDRLKKGQKLLALHQEKNQEINLLEVTVKAHYQGKLADINSGLIINTQPTLYEIDGPAVDAVAFVPLSGTSQYDIQQARIDIEGDGMAEYLHTCTSREGIHYLVKSGHPRTGILRKDIYFYLGYDVDPTCQGKDLN